jgi:hypothetical protein
LSPDVLKPTKVTFLVDSGPHNQDIDFKAGTFPTERKARNYVKLCRKADAAVAAFAHRRHYTIHALVQTEEYGAWTVPVAEV